MRSHNQKVEELILEFEEMDREMGRMEAESASRLASSTWTVGLIVVALAIGNSMGVL